MENPEFLHFYGNFSFKVTVSRSLVSNIHFNGYFMEVDIDQPSWISNLRKNDIPPVFTAMPVSYIQAENHLQLLTRWNLVNKFSPPHSFLKSLSFFHSVCPLPLSLLLSDWTFSTALPRHLKLFCPETFSPLRRHPIKSVLITVSWPRLYTTLPPSDCCRTFRFLRSWYSESDFILHWAMKALYKCNGTNGALIALAILIRLFCCVSRHMENRWRRKKERKKERKIEKKERKNNDLFYKLAVLALQA